MLILMPRALRSSDDELFGEDRVDRRHKTRCRQHDDDGGGGGGGGSTAIQTNRWINTADGVCARASLITRDREMKELKNERATGNKMHAFCPYSIHGNSLKLIKHFCYRDIAEYFFS